MCAHPLAPGFEPDAPGTALDTVLVDDDADGNDESGGGERGGDGEGGGGSCPIVGLWARGDPRLFVWRECYRAGEGDASGYYATSSLLLLPKALLVGVERWRGVQGLPRSNH